MTKPQRIEFYFDFSSPYGYLGSKLIGQIAEKHNRAVVWRPFLLGAIFKVTGGKPLVDQDLKGDYAKVDMPRTARFYGIPFKWNPIFPFASISAARAVYWREMTDGTDSAGRLAAAIYHACFGEPRDVTKVDVLCEIAAPLGIEARALADGIQDQAVKDRLRREVDEAVARKIFGSPYFLVDGQPFWGTDRLAQMERWMETGGF